MSNPISLAMRFPRPVRILLAGTLINRIGSFILPFLTLVLTRQFHLADARAGAIVTAYGVGALVSILAGGYLTDVLGRRRTLLLSLLGSGALAVTMGFTPTVGVFIPVLICYSFLCDLYRPASTAIIGDELPSDQRAAGFAALRVAVNLGFAIGTGVGGLLIDWSWRVLFIADGMTTIACGIIVMRGIVERKRYHAADDGGSVAVAPAARLAGIHFAGAITTSILFAMGFFSVFTIYPLTVTRAAGYPAWCYGGLIAVNGLLITLLEVPIVVWLRRWRRLRVAATGCVVAGIGFGMTGLILHWSWLLLAMVFVTAAEIMTLPLMMSFVSDLAPPATRGRFMGMFAATWNLAMMLNPIILMPLHGAVSERAFWPMLLLLYLPASAILLVLDRAADRPGSLAGATEPSGEARGPQLGAEL